MKTIDKIPTSKIQRASKLFQTGAKVGVNYLKYYGDKIITSEMDAKVRLNQNNADDLIEDFVEDELILIIPKSHPFARKKKKKISKEDLYHLNYITLNSSSTIRKFIDNTLYSNGIETSAFEIVMQLNSIEAINNSVNWIDCTVTGMGRGPGNTKTEYLILELKRRNEKSERLVHLLNLIKNYFEQN